MGTSSQTKFGACVEIWWPGGKVPKKKLKVGSAGLFADYERCRLCDKL